MRGKPQKIQINALDPDSIQTGLENLEQYLKFERVIIKYRLLASLAQKAAEAAAAAYPSFVSVVPKVDYEKGRAVIRAHDSEICFIEFGAGVFADPGTYDFVKEADINLGIKIYPGSWSKDHWRTFQKWDEGGRVGDYQWNLEQHAGLVKAYNAVVQNMEQIAREVFLR